MGRLMRLVGFVMGLVMLLTIFDEVYLGDEYWDPMEGRVYNKEEVDEFFHDSAAEKVLVPELDDSEIVEIWYMEHLLASWVLDAAPWNAYHSGIGFRVVDRNGKEKKKYAFDFAPRLTSHVKYVLHPTIIPVYPKWMPNWIGHLYARFAASFDMLWENEGAVRYYDNWPEKYENFTKIGTTNGTLFNKLREWVHEYEKTHTTFEPVEIVVNGSVSKGRGSSMCHDLFYNALYKLHELGFKPSPEDFIFRDHILVWAEEYEKVDMNMWQARREVTRYFKLFSGFMVLINKEFTNIRNLLVNADQLSITPYLYLGKEYYRVKMVQPFVNYCYLPVHMPPRRATLWTDENFCALENQISSNATKAFLSHLTPAHFVFVAERVVETPSFWIAVVVLLLVSSRLSHFMSNTWPGRTVEAQAGQKGQPKASRARKMAALRHKK